MKRRMPNIDRMAYYGSHSMPLPITWSRHTQISLTRNICVSNTYKLAEHKTRPKKYTNHVPSTVLNCSHHRRRPHLTSPHPTEEYNGHNQVRCWSQIPALMQASHKWDKRKKWHRRDILNLPQKCVKCRKRQQVCHYKISLYDRGLFSSAAEIHCC